MIKLLFAISSLQNSGGSERSLIYRVNYLVNNFEYDITILTTDNESISSFYNIDPKVKILNIPIVLKNPSLFRSLKSLFYKSYDHESKIMEFIHNNKFDICTSFGSINFLYNYQKGDPITRIKESRFNYKRFFPNDSYNLLKLSWGLLRLVNSVLVLKKIDYLITLTNQDAKFWNRFHKKVIVMPNFINFKSTSISTLDSNLVIAVGRLEKEKDFSSLICAFSIVSKNYKNWKLEIYGDGSQKNELQKLICDLKLTKHVFLKGANNNIFQKYKHSSIYVHTAFYEGFGNSILEAMAHSLPIVAFKSVGGVKLLVKDKLNGFIVENRNIESLAIKIMQLMKNPELRIAMGKHSRLISENYSEAKVMLDWHKFYSSI